VIAKTTDAAFDRKCDFRIVFSRLRANENTFIALGRGKSEGCFRRDDGRNPDRPASAGLDRDGIETGFDGSTSESDAAFHLQNSLVKNSLVKIVLAKTAGSNFTISTNTPLFR
jgi:hypothetical protein